MREFIDRGVLANLVSMLRADVKGAIWLADADDESRFYQQCAHAHARVLPSRGGALEILADTKNRGIAGVVAAVRGRVSVDDDVFVPSVGDVASLALQSIGCTKVLREIAGDEWVRAAEREVGPIADHASALAWRWERILLASGYIGPWPEDELYRAIDWNTFTLSETFLWSTFGDRASAFLAQLDEDEQALSLQDKLRAMDGRNAIRVIAEAAKYYAPLGLRSRQLVDVGTLVSMLNVAFEFDALENDAMFWKMRKWERRNRHFPLLQVWRSLDPLGVVWDQRYWKKDLQTLLLLQGDETLIAFKMDLDNFSGVNKALGHVGGDEAIREYLRSVQACLGYTSEIYRRGGDEVVAFAPGMTLHQAEILAERLRCDIEARFKKWGVMRNLNEYPTASIGIVEVPPGMTVDKVEELMEKAQWQAKNTGKNRVVSISNEAAPQIDEM